MPSVYPGSLPVYAPHGTNMDDPPLHNDVHLQHEQDIVAVASELGTNPSDVYTTVAARLAAMASSIAALEAINAGNRLLSLEAQVFRTVLTDGVAYAGRVHLQSNSTVHTLDAFGNATITFPEAFIDTNFVWIGMNGDSDVTAGGFMVNENPPKPSAQQVSFHCQNDDGFPVTGAVRINWLAVNRRHTY